MVEALYQALHSLGRHVTLHVLGIQLELLKTRVLIECSVMLRIMTTCLETLCAGTVFDMSMLAIRAYATSDMLVSAMIMYRLPSFIYM